jgi:hypothetical protein
VETVSKMATKINKSLYKYGKNYLLCFTRLKHLNITALKCSTKPVNSNMSFGTGFAFPYGNVPLNNTSLQITAFLSVPRLSAIRRSHCTTDDRYYLVEQCVAVGEE